MSMLFYIQFYENSHVQVLREVACVATTFTSYYSKICTVFVFNLDLFRRRHDFYNRPCGEIAPARHGRVRASGFGGLYAQKLIHRKHSALASAAGLDFTTMVADFGATSFQTTVWSP
jgi:hypothetical protein